MKDVIYLTGHKNPDTDSICSALGYAEFKNRTGLATAIPSRLGDISRETQFVLDYFGVKAPELLETVKPQVSDLEFDNTYPVNQNISIKMAWSIMKKYSLKSLPVVDEDCKLIGIISESHIASVHMDIWDTTILGKSNTSIENILETLNGKLLCEGKSVFPGKILVGASTRNKFSEYVETGDIIICANQDEVQAEAIEKNVSLVIVTGNNPVNLDLIEKAREKNVCVISTPFDTYTTSRLITQSIPVEYIMTKENLIYFNHDELIDDVRDVMLKTRYRNYPVVDSENKVTGSIARFHLISSPKKKVILLDHNEKAQSVSGIEDSEVLEIVDHHRIADVQTGSPIYFRNEPVGSTCTIVASIFFENGIRPSKKTAGLLAAAVISDTLCLTSPTTTNVDKIILNRLCEIAGINAKKFSDEMFRAATSLKGRTASEIFNQDFKTFTLNSLKIGVSQFLTMDTKSFNEVKKDMVNYMESKKEKDGYNLLILLLTDIVENGSFILAVGDGTHICKKAFDIEINNDELPFMPGVVSRKKQVIPPITSAISNS